jgi:hypothetical protein
MSTLSSPDFRLAHTLLKIERSGSGKGSNLVPENNPARYSMPRLKSREYISQLKNGAKALITAA